MKISLFVFTVLLLLGCSIEQSDEAKHGAMAVGKVANYDWYLEGSTPAGRTTIVRTGDGRITTESFVHWNNREWTVNSELRLDDNGLIVAQKVTGISPFQAKIDEEFSYADGAASWRTPGESGSVKTDLSAFYLANEGITFGADAALVRAAAGNIDSEISLFPSGSAKVEKVREVLVSTPDGARNLALYALHGIGFTPSYRWINEDMEIAAYDSDGYLGMIPRGWDISVLAKLSEAQSGEVATYMKRQAGDLARRMESPVLFENVDVVDVVNGKLLRRRNVLVADGFVAAISEATIESGDAVRIDGSGKSLMPGLWDMHGHFSLSDGVLNIAGGVVNVRDIGSVHEKIMESTAKYDSGEVIGPNTYRAGFIDRAGPYASGWAAETLADALDRVDFFARHDYIQIKLYSSIDPEWVAPIAERAHAHGMRLSGHIPAFMSAEQAVRAGYDEIQHINMVFLNFSAADREDTRKQLRFTLYGDEAGNLDLQSREAQDFFDLLRENDIVIDATAAIFDTQLRHVQGQPDPTFAAVVEHLPASIARKMYNPEMEMGDMADAWHRSAGNQAAMLKALHEHGIQLVPGSDSLPAFTLHREIELYSEAGIPNADVLRIATLDSARVTGVSDRKGSVETGKVSDLILIDGNPFEDISAIRRAVLVMKGNTLYRPDELYESVGVRPFVASVEIR